LSYTWGNPHSYGREFEDHFKDKEAEYSLEAMVPIRCNGKILKIGKNLHQFLTQAPTNWIRRIRNRQDQNTGRTRLHNTVATDDYRLVHLQLSEGADVNLRDNMGQTPLHLAASNDYLETVRVLLKGGASCTAKDSQGQTPKDLAVANGHQSTANFLHLYEVDGPNGLVDDVPPIDRFISMIMYGLTQFALTNLIWKSGLDMSKS
jgi:hypothetical protein